MGTLMDRYVASVLDAPRLADPAGPGADLGRGRSGYSLWQRYLASLTRTRLPLRTGEEPRTSANRRVSRTYLEALLMVAVAASVVLLIGGEFALFGHRSQPASAKWPYYQVSPEAAGVKVKPTGGGDARGTVRVRTSPAVAHHPHLQQVVSLIEGYFTAINKHDYARYARLMEPSQRPTRQEFESGFRSAVDSRATLTGLVPTATGLAATVKFISHQSPSDSPNGTRCDSWHITLFIEPQGGGYRIGPARPGYRAKYEAC